MTAPTPEQMRALAKGPSGCYGALSDHLTAVHAALRAAADQLEAVEATIGIYRNDDEIEAHWLVGRLDALPLTGKEAADHV